MLTERFARWLRHCETGSGTGFSPYGSIVVSTDLGLTRAQNQDRVATMNVTSTPTRSAFSVTAVADGMGGMKDGLECAVRTLAAFFAAVNRLKEYEVTKMLSLAALESNREVHRLYSGRGGATLSAIVVESDGAVTTLNVGDSRIYGRIVDTTRADVIRMTTDDNLEEAVGGTGKELLQFIGMGTGIRPHITQPLSILDRIMISSDGAHFIDHAVIKDILLNTREIADSAKQLLTYARWRGSPDNASVALVDIEKNVYELTAFSEGSYFLLDPFGTLVVEQEFRSTSARKATALKQPALPSEDATSRHPKRARRLRSPQLKPPNIDSDPQLSIEIGTDPNMNKGEEGNS
jgi:serine/threonine protein phosphatase PrpC